MQGLRRIDVHTHILPEQLPDFNAKFGETGYVTVEHGVSCNCNVRPPDHYLFCLQDASTHCVFVQAKMWKDGKMFREIEPNCWSPEHRLKECDETNVTVQVLSTVPVLFNYWAKPEQCMETSRFLNDHIAQICRASPDRFIGILCFQCR
jgi:aminocarboxymuconate-semialdehyde decarboxylase